MSRPISFLIQRTREMKVCPSCGFTNEERFPTCVWCNTVLVEVRSTPSADPDHPEHARRALARQRRGITRRQLGLAALGYMLTITALAACPGFIFDPQLLCFYFAGSAVVATAVLREWIGTFSSAFLQGACSVLLVLHYGPMQPFIIFMLAGQIVLPMVFCLWVEMIHETNR